jgi:hypothetical protein
MMRPRGRVKWMRRACDQTRRRLCSRPFAERSNPQCRVRRPALRCPPTAQGVPRWFQISRSSFRSIRI